MKVLKLNPSTLTQESRYHTQDFAERVSVLQHEWIRSALYILVKHNHKFMEGLGEYATVQGNPALRATNWSGERIFSMVNRILSSHSDVRAPIISGIVKIRALGEGFFKQLHNEYASPETWAKAREILASCPTQRDLSTARLDHWEGCSGQRQQARQSWFIFFGQLACQNGLIKFSILGTTQVGHMKIKRKTHV